jgi:hypothetical protein
VRRLIESTFVTLGGDIAAPQSSANRAPSSRVGPAAPEAPEITAAPAGS